MHHGTDTTKVNAVILNGINYTCEMSTVRNMPFHVQLSPNYLSATVATFLYKLLRLALVNSKATFRENVFKIGLVV